MKYFYYVLAIAFSIQSSHSQIVNIYDTNFKEALIASGIDTNGDNEIQITEAEAVTSLDVSDDGIFDPDNPFKRITDLSGIEYFKNLELLDISFNEIRDLDISALTNLKILLCERNYLESLDISMLSNLKKLDCYQNRLTTLSLK